MLNFLSLATITRTKIVMFDVCRKNTEHEMFAKAEYNETQKVFQWHFFVCIVRENSKNRKRDP